MEENSKVYRIRTKVGEDSPNVIHVPINQTYDTFEILSLKLNQTDTYKTYESGYGIIVGRVIANGGFGVPNSKVSVFIEVDDNESLKDTLLYNFTSTSDTDNDGVRYNLLPDYVESECHQDVGTFPNKRLVLDNDDVIEIFDKYWKYTTTTNNSGDYMLFGVPTGSQQLHVDIDLSDCGVLSQRPHNMIGKGYNIGMFESPNKFKSSTNLDSLPQIVTEDRGVYVYPYWGDTSNGDNTFAITRCDINIEYKFEPTAVFMGSIITDKGSNAIGKNCTATINNGKMSELVTGEGTIEMIRKTIDGRVEQFPIMGNRVIDGDGTWVYEIPMNLDYVTTDEFGNFVPTDNPDKGIATRARVRFRVRLDDTQYDNTARKRACYLIPNNPRLEDEGFDKTMEVDYEFGSLTREESYRDLFWNKVYTVKNYIPKIQKGDEQYNRQHTGIKWVNHANHNNPMPYNTLTVKLSFVHRIICILTGLVVQFVAFINQIISLLGFLFATLFDLPSVLFNGLAKLLEDRICLPWPLDDVCVGDLLALIFRGIGKGASSINILGKMATKLLTPTCIVLDSGFCDDNVNKVDFYPGCGYFLFNLFPLSSATDVVERGDIAWEKTQEAQQEKYNGKSSDEVRTASNHTGKLHNCYENALAQENEATSFNFNNDWINGTLYAPLWYRKITPKKRFLFGLFTRKAKDEWCTSKQYFASLRYIQHCAVERDGSKTITNFDGDTTDLKFIRNSECVDGDCHERHVALPGLGGVIHSKKTMLGQDVYYYKPVEWSANLPSNELYTGKKKGELKLLFATDIVLLGSLDSCDMNGVPQFFKNLESTTYNMPGDILFTDYEFHYVIDPETGNATSNYNTQDYTVHSEMAGCDWGNPNEFNKKDGGLFYSIGCTNGETELKAKSCVNLSRICEYGVSLDVTKQIPIINNENIGKWEDASESEIEQAEDGTYYKRLITDGFISWDELYNLDERSMFATMNGNQLKTKINTNNGLKEYDFRYLYPENFDGSLAERMKRQTQNYPPEINYKFNYLLEKASRDYYLFRMGNKPYYYDSNNAFPRYENSFYFYFGLNEGKTAIEKFNSKYFAECDNEKGVYNNFNIYKKSSSWCSSLNETYDGFIALDLEKIATPYSIVITGDNTFTLDGITDEKIIFYNKSYSAPEGFEDYADNKFEEFKDEKTFIPNGSYYMTITDANGEEYHYELDMGYNFLTYSNNVQSFKKNHEDLLRSLGTNNAIMNDNTKLVYSNPEKIEREIGGVITVYGVHDNDGDIEQYKIEVREIVDFDKTDIQKTIKNVGDTWYDEEGNLCKVTSIDKNGTIHYTKNGEEKDEKGNPYTIVGRNTVEDYEGMKKELVVPEWYDKNAVKHNLTEKDKNGKYVYEEGAQQADFNPLVNKLEKDEIWYDTDGNFCKVTSIDTDGTIHYAKNGEGNYTIVGRDTVVDYTDWTLELNLPTYYDKNGEKQYYPYQPNKETSVVDFELTDRLKKLTDVGDTWYDADGNLCKVTTIDENGTIHYTKNGEGDYTDKKKGDTVVDYSDWTLEVTPPTWYDLDGYFCKVTSITPQGKEVITADEWGSLTSAKREWYEVYEYVNNIDEKDIITKERWESLSEEQRAKYKPHTYVNNKLIIYYTKNGEGDNTIVDYTISGRNTVTEVTFNSSLENTPYLEYLYNLNKGDEYVKKYDLEDSDGVEYGISYKVISPYALTISEYEDKNFSDYGKFDYDVYDYINKQNSSIIIDVEAYNQLEGGYGQKSYDVYDYINKQDSSKVIDTETYNQLDGGYGQKSYVEVYVKNDGTEILTKEQWEALDPVDQDNYEKKYKNKYDATIITSDDWGKLPTEYCKGDYEIYQYVNKYDATIITSDDWGKLSTNYCKGDYEVHRYVNKDDESNIITPEAYNGLSDGYGKNHYKTDITYCKKENKTEHITKEEYANNEDIQFLYQQFHILNENEKDILIENGYEESLKEKDYKTIIVNYEKLAEELVIDKTEIKFYTKDSKDEKSVRKGSNGWYYKTEDKIIGGNYIIDYINFLTPLEDGDYYYTYEGERKQYNNETPTVTNDDIELDFISLVRVLSFDTWLDEDGALCEFTSITPQGEKILTSEQWDTLSTDEKTLYDEVYLNKTDSSIIISKEEWETLDTEEQANYAKMYRSKAIIHYTKNGESGYTIVGRDTVINYNQPIWTKITRSDDNYSWVDKNGVTQYASAETLVVDYSWLLKTIAQEEIVWYDKEGNAYKVTSIDADGKIHHSINGKGDYNDKKLGDIVVDFNHDSFILILDDIDDAWYDKNGALCEVTSIDADGTIHYTMNGEGDYTIDDRNTVVNYYKFMTEPLYIPTWYDADGNLYKVTSIAPQGEKILTDEQWNTLTKDEKTLYVEVYVNKQDSSIIINLDTYNQLDGGYGQKSYEEVYVKNDDETVLTKEEWEALAPVDQDNYEKKYKNSYVEKDIISPEDWGKLPTEYCKEDYAEAYVNKTDETDVISKQQWEALESDEEREKYAKMYRSKAIIHYTKNGEEEDEEHNPYTIVGRDTVVDWSEYIGYEGAEITYDNGVITEIKNVLWYDSEKQSFAFGVPDENRTYVITVTQLCNVFDKVFETKNSIKTNVFVSGVIKYKMFINGIDYEIIKNFDGYTGWSYNGTITKNKLTTNVGDLNENNPWFNVDKIYYHNYFEGKDNNKDEYPKINLKDIDRFGIDKDENQQTYRIYATEIDKEDEEVGKKVNETYHGEDGKNKTVKAKDVIATFVNKRNEDDVTTYKVIHFTTKKLTVVGDTWYDADGNLCKVTNVVPQGKEILTDEQLNPFTIDEKKLYVEAYVNKQDSSKVIDVDTYDKLPEYNQGSYEDVYVNNTDETDIRSKEQWESIEDPDEKDKYAKMYRNKYVKTEIISPEDWGKLPTEYCKRDYTKMYRNKYVIIHYTKNGEGDYRGRVTWYDADGYFCEVTSIDTDGTIHYTKNSEGNYTIVGRNTVVDYSVWKITLDITTQDTENYFKQYRNKYVSTDFISPETYKQLSKGYSQNSYNVYNYINKQDSSVKTIEEYNKLPDGYSQKSYDVYQYINKTDKEDIITKTEWEGLSEKEHKKYEPYKYVNKYDATKFITSDDWGDLPKDYCKRDYEVYKYVNKHDATKFITSDEWGKLPEYCQEDYTEVYLSTWYDKNGTLNYMLPSEKGQERIDFRPLVKTIEKEGETWYDVNSVERVAGSDDIGQEVLDYSKENNNLTQLKEIDFTTADKTWYDKNGIENKADSDKLGLYIDITYMTKGGDTILFNIYNEEYIDKLVIDKLVIKYVNKQDSSKVIDTEAYNQLLDGYSQKSYEEVYVKNDGTEILTKEQWESIEDPDEKDKYVKMYCNKYVESNIITPDDWGKLSPDYCKSDYQLCSVYKFNRNGLHSVRIYLTQKTTYGDLLSNVIDFKGCSNLNTIVLPNIGITTIGANVFNGCKSLTSIDLPDSITAIGNNAFKGCEKLSSVYIPYKVKTIGNSAFNGCKSLTNIVLPKNITTIGDNAFVNCEKLQSVRAEMTIKNDGKINIAHNAFDNTNIGLIIYVPMDKDEKIYDNSTIYNKEVWGNVKDKVVAIELTVFNYNKVNINPSDLLDEFARNTGDNKIYYNFIDSYVASEYKLFTQVTYFKASDFVNTINNVLSRRREIADRMFNTFYMTQEGESKSFNITSNTDEMPVQPIIVYHEEEIDDVDIDYTLTTPNLTYEQINMLKNVNIPTITYKSSPFFGDGTSSDDIMITKSNNIEKKPLSTGIMNVKQKSIPLDSGNKDFPSISLSGGVKAIKPSKTNIADLFEFPVIDKIESSSVSAWTKFSNIPSPNPDHIGMINMDGYVYGRHNNGVVERDCKFETRKLGKYEINLSENLNNSTKQYTYAERRVITGLANYSMAQWCILKLRNIVQTDDVTEETLKKIWDMLFNPKNEKGKPLYNKEKLFDVIDTMTVLKQTIDENLVIYIQCDETIDGVKPQWKIDQGEEDYITENLIQFKKFNVVAYKDYERQYAFTDTKKANLNIGEINENFNFDNELKLSTEVESIDVSGHTTNENLTRLSFNQGEKEGGHYQLFALSRYRDGFYGKEDMNQYPLYNAAKNGIVYQIDGVEKETMLSHEGEITKINDKEKQIQGTFNEDYHSSYFHSMYKFKGSNDDERVWRNAESTNGLYISNKNFNNNYKKFTKVTNDYFLDPKYIRHVYCVYVKGNMKMLSPLYEFAPTQLVGTWGHLESYDERDKSVIGIKVNDFARVYFKYYDYTLGGPFKIKRKHKTFYTGYKSFSYTIPEGRIKYKDEDYYYMIVDDKLKDKDNKNSYEFENNMGAFNEYSNFHKDHVIAKDITDLRHVTWTNGNILSENSFILIKWEVPESDSFRFISEQKNTETEDFDELTTVEKVYIKGQELKRLPKNNGQYKDGDLWTIQYKNGKETKDIETNVLLSMTFDGACIITKNIIK